MQDLNHPYIKRVNSATDNAPVRWDSTTGQLVQDSTSITIDDSGNLTANSFAGDIAGNVTGNCSGSSGSCTGNAATATKLETARTIAGNSFDGTANITIKLDDLSAPTSGAIKKTIVLTGQGGVPSTTSGCALPAQTELANGQNFYTLDFDTGSDEYACWTIVLADNYDGGTLTAVFYWTAAAGTLTNTVQWAIQGIAYADSDAMNAAFGDAVSVSDALITLNDMHISSATSAITLAGSPAGGQAAIIRVYRDVSEDNIENDVKLIAVKLEYGINAISA
jgi:hypothetical protein